MVYRGYVKGGVVVLEPPNVLPEGAEVRVEVVPSEIEGPMLDESGETLGQKLMKYAGRAVCLKMPPSITTTTCMGRPNGETSIRGRGVLPRPD